MNLFSLLLPSRPRHSRGGIAATARACALVLAAVLIPSAYARLAAGQEMAVTEYQLKAAFLYNFAKFVEWPEQAFGSASASFRLCVVGGEPFAGAQQTLAGKSVKGRSVEVRRIDHAGQAQGCHMLFVGAQEAGGGAPVLAAIGPHTLTVGETSGFAGQGGMINLTRVDDKIRFEIDRAAGERFGFRFSSQLLKLAILVGSRP